MKIKSVSYQNFSGSSIMTTKSYGENGSVLILGENGIGKSTELSSIIWCISGKTLNDATSLRDVSYKGLGECIVELELEKDNKSYTIKRFLGCKDEKNGVKIWQDDKEITCTNSDDTQNLIYSIFGSRDVFIKKIMFPQQAKESFLKKTDSEQKQIIEEMSNISSFDIEHEKFKSEKKRIDEEIQTTKVNIEKFNSALDESITNENIQKEKYNKNIEEQTKTIEKLKEEKNKLEEQCIQNGYKTKKDYLDAKNKLMKEYASTSSEISNIDNKKAELLNKYENSKTIKLNAVQKQIDDVRNSYIVKQTSMIQEQIDKNNNETKEKLNKLYDQHKKMTSMSWELSKTWDEKRIKYENDIISLKQRIEPYSSENQSLIGQNQLQKNTINKLNDVLSMDNCVCPTCLSLIDENSKENIKKSISEIKSIIIDNNIKISKNDNEISKYKYNILIIEKQIKEEEQKIKTEKINIENILNDINFKIDAANQELVVKNNTDKNKIFEEFIPKFKELEKEYNIKSQEIEQEYETEKLNINDKMDKQKKVCIDMLSIHAKNLELLNQYDNIYSEIDRIESMIHYSEESLKIKFDDKSFKDRQLDLTTRIELSNNMIKLLEDKLFIVSFWETATGKDGIRNYIIGNRIDYINERIDYYTEKLNFPGKIIFSNTNTTIGGKIQNKISIKVERDGFELNSKLLSGGESRLAEIIIFLALFDLGIVTGDNDSSNIVFFDEPFDALSEVNSDKVFDLLCDISKDKEIRVISHSKIWKSKAFDTIIEL